MSKNYLRSFGATVREIRTDLQLSQEKLGEAAGLDRTYISDIERGGRNVSLLNIVSLAKALAKEPKDLLPRINELHQQEYWVNSNWSLESGFHVTSQNVLEATLATNAILEALPMNIYSTIDYKAQSGLIGAIYVLELANRIGAIPNPIEKGYPDIVPAEAIKSNESTLRNYPTGLEVKSTFGNATTGADRTPGVARIESLASITWQAHHSEGEQLMGITWDYVGGTQGHPAPPSITGIFYAGNITVNDWGKISGTKGRNTKVTGMKASGKKKMAEGCVIILNNDEYKKKILSRLGKKLTK